MVSLLTISKCAFINFDSYCLCSQMFAIYSYLEKEYIKAVYCHPAYLTYMQSTS